jgi:hypothetical protein
MESGLCNLSGSVSLEFAPGGGVLWGHPGHSAALFCRLAGDLFQEWNPRATTRFTSSSRTDVSRCRVVDNESDKNVAGIKARSVSGSFGVDNQLVVVGGRQSTKR